MNRFIAARLVAAVALALTLPGATLVQAAELSLRFIGSHAIPTGTRFEGLEFGGISGIDRLPDGRYVALSDDRGGERGAPRFYTLSLHLSASAFTGVTIHSQTFLRRPDGSPFPSDRRTVDPEAIRVLPHGHLAWTSEGNWSSDPAALHQPLVREMRPDGSFVRSYTLPGLFDYVDNRSAGGRDNKLFEALALTPGGTLYTANEDALIPDGDPATLTSGSVLRVTAIDTATGQAGRQYAYRLPPIPVAAARLSPFPPDNGLVELLAIDDTSFIALERAFAFGVGNTIRLVKTTITAQTTDVSGLPRLVGAAYTPMTRELLLEMPITFEGVTLDNLEAMTWGPVLPNGNRTLVLVADNNFSRFQTTLFMAFEVSARTRPASTPR